jgi:hypothetical protein
VKRAYNITPIASRAHFHNLGHAQKHSEYIPTTENIEALIFPTYYQDRSECPEKRMSGSDEGFGPYHQN